VRHMQQENMQAALALLLGPETDYTLRIRAARRLARQGSAILPLVLATLNHYPEITSPPWPWWPPQYEHCGRLLLHLSQDAQVDLEALLHPPFVIPPAGPVLWTSVIEAAGLIPHTDHEELLRNALETPWPTVRYAAAMALAIRARKIVLQHTTLTALHVHQGEHEDFPVRLTASYALFSSGESIGLDVLIELMEASIPLEVRRAATFVLATEPSPIHFSLAHRERLMARLVSSLRDQDHELTMHAAHALGKIAQPAILPTLSRLLDENDPPRQIAVLTALEEMAARKTIRHAMHQQGLPTSILPLLKSPLPEVRQQASYALAACGGEYGAAVLGTIVLNREHPGHIEAIEGLRLLHGALRYPLRANVVRWLLGLLPQSGVETQVAVLDSLTHLLWQARSHGQKRAWQDICQEIVLEGTALRLLDAESAWVRQRVIELLTIFGPYLDLLPELPPRLAHLLHTDENAGVRAGIAYMYSRVAARWALPALLQALLDPDEHVAQTALTALSQLATPDDAIVRYALTELARLYNTHDPHANTLARAARQLLKKWQRAEQGETVTTLHSFGEQTIL